MAITAQQLLTAYTRDKVNLNDVDNALFIQWCNFLNRRIYRYVIEADYTRYVSRQSYTPSSDPSAETLPSDFKTINKGTCGLYKVDANGKFVAPALPKVNIGSTKQGYYFEGSTLYITGFSSSTNITMRYIPVAGTIDELTDSFNVPDEYEEVLERLTDVYYEIWNENPTAEFLASSRFSSALDEMMADIPQGSTVYGFTNTYLG